MIFDSLPFPEGGTPADNLGWLMMGYRMTQLVYVAAELGIPDYLADGPKSAQELAVQAGAHAGHLHRVLRALASIGVFDHREDDTFGQNPLSELLREDVEGSVRDSAIRHGAEWSWLPWGALLHSVRTGEPAFDHALGQSHWEYMAGHPQAREGFGQAMAESTAMIVSAIVNDYDFPAAAAIVDVGGGHGALLAGILKTYPSASGILLDRAENVESAQKTLSSQGVIDRCQVVAGDFFTSVPAGGDVYILQRIIHDWDDEQAVLILQNCRQAMGEEGRVLIIERLVPETADPSAVKIVDVTVMVLYRKARERTESEFRHILDKAGLRLARVRPLQIPAPLIETAGYSLLEGIPR